MSADPTWPVQVAMVDTLNTALPVEVYDAPPQGVRYPYIVVGEAQVLPEDDKTGVGHVVTVNIHAWQRAEYDDEERGSYTPKQLLGQCYAALHRQPLQVAGQAVYIQRFESASYFMDVDGRTSRGVARYRIILHADN